MKVHSLVADAADEAQVVKGMAESIEALGRVDFVCANAGRGKGAPAFTEMTTEPWR